MENYTTSNQVIAPVNFQDREVFDRTLTREKRDDITADAEITYCSAKKKMKSSCIRHVGTLFPIF